MANNNSQYVKGRSFQLPMELRNQGISGKMGGSGLPGFKTSYRDLSKPMSYAKTKGALSLVPAAVGMGARSIKNIYEADPAKRLQSSNITTSTRTGRDLLKLGDLGRAGTGGLKLNNK